MDTKPIERADESLEMQPSIASDAGGPVGSVKRTRRTAIFTSAPAIPPPKLLCPNCDVVLAYRQTVISGVKPIERWDYFDCATCGPFIYRDRTRKLRPTT
jgi:predicted RNA-binding Zn-ribbon protein involved in translation (DUF1610 family)